MAFGFPPKYVQNLPLEGITPQQFIVLAIEAANQLGWNVGYKSETGFVAYTKFSMMSWSEEVTVTVDGDNAILLSKCTGSQIVDWGKNRQNIESLVDEFELLKNAAVPEELDDKCEEFKTELVAKEEGALGDPPSANKGNMLSLFIPSKGYTVTPVLIWLNIAVFVAMVISGVNFLEPDTQSLVKWGANFRPSTLQNEWWRLITNVFLHIGILHLLLNMYALLYIGLLLEPYLGKLRFLSAYLLTGIAASTASLWFHDQTVSAGASGAIFGMYGVFLAMLTTNFIDAAARKALLTSIGVFVVYNLVNGMKPGIDNAAHIGGLVSGFIIGYLYYPSLKNPDAMDIKFGSIMGLTIVTFLTCFFVCKRVPNYMAAYNDKMTHFASMESMALELYRMPKTTSRDSLLMEVKDRGLYYWNEDIQLIEDAEKLDLPPALHKRDKTLLRYCNLRIASYNLIYKAIDENTDKYKDSINNYNQKIQGIIDSLSAK